MDENPGGYRDERASLAAENARLKAELAGVRGARRSARWRAFAAALTALADVGAFTQIVRLVNAPHDGDVWLGWSLAVLTVVANVAVAQRVLRSRG